MSLSPFGRGFQVSISDLQDEFGQMLGRLWHTGISTPPLDGHKWAPPIDLLDTPTQYVLTAEVPGLNVEDIEVAFEEGELVLRGHKANGLEEGEDVAYHRRERRFGSFCRRIPLPEPVLEESVTARCRHGVLEVVLPKKELPERKTVKVEIRE